MHFVRPLPVSLQQLKSATGEDVSGPFPRAVLECPSVVRHRSALWSHMDEWSLFYTYMITILTILSAGRYGLSAGCSSLFKATCFLYKSIIRRHILLFYTDSNGLPLVKTCLFPCRIKDELETRHPCVGWFFFYCFKSHYYTILLVISMSS